MNQIDIDEFEMVFHKDLESLFTADIKCCSECLEGFKSYWPKTTQISTNLVSISSDEMLQKGRRLKSIYSKVKYDEFMSYLFCPRCGAELKDNTFYPFEFGVNDFEDFEYYIDNITNTIKETPFLVLKNETAILVYDLIQGLYRQNKSHRINNCLYRGRSLNKDTVLAIDLLPPSIEYCIDGRYNHRGIPVLYCSTSKETCYYEMRRPNKNLWIAEFEINKSLNFLDLTNIMIESEDNNLLKTIIWSSLLSTKSNDESNYKPEYYFSRFISDCCKEIGFDGIAYPSVQIGRGRNYVFFDTNLMNKNNIKAVNKFEV